MTNQPHATPEPLATDTREALPVVAWWVELLGLGTREPAHASYLPEPLCRLSDAEAEIARLRADAERMREQLDEANTALDAIGDYAHDHSAGPTVWDSLWEVRSMAYNAIQPIAIDKARSATSGEAT